MSLQSLAHALGWNLAFWSALAGYSLACTGAGLLTMRLLGGASGVQSNTNPAAQTSRLRACLGLACWVSCGSCSRLAACSLRPVVYPIVVLLIVAALAIRLAAKTRSHSRSARAADCAPETTPRHARAADRGVRVARVHLHRAGPAVLGRFARAAHDDPQDGRRFGHASPRTGFSPATNISASWAK